MFRLCESCLCRGRTRRARYTQRRSSVCSRCSVKYETLVCLRCGQKCVPLTARDNIEVLDLSCPCYDKILPESYINYSAQCKE